MKLIEFLKKYTKINNEFIDDFFGLYDEKDKYNFCIDIDIVSKWMNMTKGHIKETLLYSYNENIDYIIKKEELNGKIGKPNKKIFITPKCFKLFTMQSKNKKSKQIREYYYELEEVIDKYKEHIIQSMNDKIKKLENNQKPKVNPKKGIIYIIETSDKIGHYKIGKTKNLKKRLNSYNQDKIDDITPLYIYETDDIERVEKCIKLFGKEYQYRKYKEVYKTNIDMLKKLINNCGEFKEKLILIDKNKSVNNNKKKNYYIALYEK